MALCTHCSHPLPPEGRFCVHCGQAVAKTLACSHCQQDIPEGSRFCVHCGQAAAGAVATPSPASPTVVSQPTITPSAPAAIAPISESTPSNVSPPQAFRWGRLVTAGMVVASLALGYLKFPRSPAPPTAPTPALSPTVVLTPTASLTPTMPGPDIGELADTWSVEPTDSAYQAGQKEANELVLERQGDEVRGHGPENSPFRFWLKDGQIVGEARDPEGKLHQLRWEWSQPGQKARLSVSGEGEGHTLSLRRGPAAPAPPPSLYSAVADLNGDGKPESVEVVALDGNPTPNAASTKVLKVCDQSGSVLFQSEPFAEPFHTDLDHLAEAPDQTSGLHILAGQPYPRIRLIFATRSGNFVDFHYDGRGYSLAEIGD